MPEHETVGQAVDFQSDNQTLKQYIRQAVKRYLPKHAVNVLRLLKATRPIAERTCPCCNYHGFFDFFGSPPRIDARCPQCQSLERHRLFYLAYEHGLLSTAGMFLEPVLHFAPEASIEKMFRQSGLDYKTADLFIRADLKLNLEQIGIPDETYMTVIGNHVLEHVDDRSAVAELYRILKPGGVLIASTPIVEGWDKTYECDGITSHQDRVLRFGQWDHVRYFGRDFRDRVATAGFTLEREITAEGEDVIKYGLLRGEKLFVFRK